MNSPGYRHNDIIVLIIGNPNKCPLLGAVLAQMTIDSRILQAIQRARLVRKSACCLINTENSAIVHSGKLVFIDARDHFKVLNTFYKQQSWQGQVPDSLHSTSPYKTSSFTATTRHILAGFLNSAINSKQYFVLPLNGSSTTLYTRLRPFTFLGF